MKELENIVLIGDYDNFFRFDVIVNGRALKPSQLKEIRDKLSIRKFEDYGELFRILFPNKIVIYNCDGEYWYFRKGFLFNFEVIETT